MIFITFFDVRAAVTQCTILYFNLADIHSDMLKQCANTVADCMALAEYSLYKIDVTSEYSDVPRLKINN